MNLSQRYRFVTDSFSASRAYELLQDEILPFQFGAFREALLRATVALETGAVWLEQGKVFCASGSRAGVVYEVKAGSCGCPATRLCYHRVARRLLFRFFALWRQVEADLDEESGADFFERISSQPNQFQSVTIH
jgi:hypothetical protein